ncbi:MAG: hypothetical protein J6Z30_08720, partial [Pyramidobacter sp.]|nr:hypothetical protein [Pyramidobacter sp.]
EVDQPMHLQNYILQRQGQNVRMTDSDRGGARFASLISRPAVVRDGLTLTKVTLETGRKHQIRAQHAHAGSPIWGDNRYGHGRAGMQIALWAMSLTIEHPTRHEPMTFKAVPPNVRPWDKFQSEIGEIIHENEV